MSTRRQVFARYYSPGTMFSEMSDRELETGSLVEATEKAKTIKERHGATPYAFDLLTKIVASPVPDGEGGFLDVESKVVSRRGKFFLGGKIVRYNDVDQKADRILASNMQGNRYPVCIENTNSYRSTNFFGEDDVIVDPESGKIIRRGDDDDLVEYREQKLAEWKAEMDRKMAEWGAKDRNA